MEPTFEMDISVMGDTLIRNILSTTGDSILRACTIFRIYRNGANDYKFGVKITYEENERLTTLHQDNVRNHSTGLIAVVNFNDGRWELVSHSENQQIIIHYFEQGKEVYITTDNNYKGDGSMVE